MFTQTKEIEVTMLLDATCNIGKTTLPLAMFYECRDILIRDKQLTVSVYAGVDNDALVYYKSYSFEFPSENFTDVSTVESQVLALEEFALATVI